MADIGGLTVDPIHPADNGTIQMGENLARRIAPLVTHVVARCSKAGKSVRQQERRRQWVTTYEPT